MQRKHAIPVAIVAVVIVAYVGLRLSGVGVTRHPKEAARLRLEARALLDAGKQDEAVALLRSALVKDAHDVDTHREYQNVMRNVGREDEMIREYEQRAAADPRDPAMHYLLARGRKTVEERMAGMRKVLETWPNYVMAHKALGNLHYDRKEWREALPHLEAVAPTVYAIREDLVALILAAHNANDVTRVGEWLKRWRELSEAGDAGGGIPCLYLRKDGDRSVTLWLGHHPGSSAYVLMVTRGDIGSRYVGVGRARNMKWFEVEQKEWVKFGQGIPNPDELMSGASGTLDREPEYPLIYGRAMRFLGEEK